MIPCYSRAASNAPVEEQGEADLIDAMVEFMPHGAIGTRKNMDIGVQFAYRFNISVDGDVLASTVGFSNRLFLTALSAPAGSGLDFDRFLSLPSWREVI